MNKMNINNLKNKLKNSKIFNDCFINIVASMMVTVTLQLLVYPILAEVYGVEKYGDILTAMAIFNILLSSIGNVLNNTRLIANQNYQEHKQQGDFNILIIALGILGAIIAFFISKCVYHLEEAVWFGIATLIGILRAYYIVSYRLFLEFQKNLVSNLFLILGYGVGLLVAFLSNNWLFVFGIGEGSSLLYVLMKTSLKSEKWQFTNLFGSTLKLFLQLAIVSIIGNLLVYFDRILVNPLLGATSVAIFSVAAFWGKSLGSFFEPIANVLLGYFSSGKYKISIKNYLIICSMSILCILAFFAVGCVIAPYLVKFLYPSLYEATIPYIPLVSFATLLPSVITFVRPAVLVVCNKSYLLVLQVLYTIAYIWVSMGLSGKYGLTGFSAGLIISNLFYVVLFIGLGLYSIKRKNR